MLDLLECFKYDSESWCDVKERVFSSAHTSRLVLKPKWKAPKLLQLQCYYLIKHVKPQIRIPLLISLGGIHLYTLSSTLFYTQTQVQRETLHAIHVSVTGHNSAAPPSSWMMGALLRGTSPDIWSPLYWLVHAGLKLATLQSQTQGLMDWATAAPTW